MKTQLTASESTKLIELGVSPERASMCLLNLDYDSEVIPCEDVWEEDGRLLANVNDEVIDVDRKMISKDLDFDHSYANDNPIFTLTDIIDILPKEINRERIEIGYDCDGWYGEYNHLTLPGSYSFAPELIDALYLLLLWCLEKGYVKLN